MINVSVTEAHIKKGIPGDAVKCPIALALKSSGVKNAEVNEGFIEFTSKNKKIVIAWYYPKELKKFQDSFDKGKPVEPFEFHIPVSLD